jgi:hypothetical protein
VNDLKIDSKLDFLFADAIEKSAATETNTINFVANRQFKGSSSSIPSSIARGVSSATTGSAGRENRDVCCSLKVLQLFTYLVRLREFMPVYFLG